MTLASVEKRFLRNINKYTLVFLTPLSVWEFSISEKEKLFKFNDGVSLILHTCCDLPCTNGGITVQEWGIWSILLANNPGSWKGQGFSEVGLGCPHTSGWCKIVLHSVFPTSETPNSPISVPFPGDYFSLADCAAGKIFLIFNPISPLIPFMLLVAPKRILPLLGVFAPENFRLFLMVSYNYSSTDLHIFHMCQQTGTASWMNRFNSESFSWALTSSISLHLGFDLWNRNPQLLLQDGYSTEQRERMM